MRTVCRPKSAAVAKTVVADAFAKFTTNDDIYLAIAFIVFIVVSYVNYGCIVRVGLERHRMDDENLFVQMGAFFTFHLVYGGSIGPSYVIWHEIIERKRAQQGMDRVEVKEWATNACMYAK